MKASKGLRRQAKNNDAAMFEASIFPKEFDKIAQKCYLEQMDAFSKLFEDEQFYRRVMSEMGKAIYLSCRNDGDDAPKSGTQYAPISEENLGEYGSMAAEDLRKDDDRAEN